MTIPYSNVNSSAIDAHTLASIPADDIPEEIWFLIAGESRVGPYRSDDSCNWRNAGGAIVAHEVVCREAMRLLAMGEEPATMPPTRRNVAFDEVAAQLHGNGYSPMPLSSKKARIGGWTETFAYARPSLHDVVGAWGVAFRGVPLDGVGVATFNGLVILDIETDAILDAVRAVVPGLDCAPACVGGKGRKAFFRAEDGSDVIGWNLLGETTGKRIEVLAHGRQGAIPPTMHPLANVPYRWIDDGERS